MRKADLSASLIANFALAMTPETIQGMPCQGMTEADCREATAKIITDLNYIFVEIID